MVETWVESAFGGLLIKVSSEMKGEVKGKVYFIPQSALGPFEFLLSDPADFDNKLSGLLLNLDYAIFKQDLNIQGSAG